MSTEGDLFAAIVEAPDDDDPRLVWADAVGNERGELVVLQCRLAREDLAPAEHAAIDDRVRTLLEAHGPAWSGFAEEPAVTRCLFRRGFVEAVEVNVTEMPWMRVFDIAPLATGLELRGLTQMIDHRPSSHAAGLDPIALVAGVFAQPAFDRVRAIGFDGVARYETYGDDEWSNEWTSRADELLELIARTGRLAGIRALAIRDPFTPRGMHELLSSNALASLEMLLFSHGVADVTQVRELLQSTPQLRVLELGAEFDAANIAGVLPPSVRLLFRSRTLVHASPNPREASPGYGVVRVHR